MNKENYNYLLKQRKTVKILESSKLNRVIGMDFMNNIIKKYTKNIWHDIYIRKLLLLEGQIDIYYDYGLFDNEYTGRNNCNNNLYKLSIFANIEDTSNNCIEIKFYSWYKKYSFRLITLFLSKNLDDLRGSVYYSNDNFNTILFKLIQLKAIAIMK